jgi:hypothetical protein
LVENLKVLASFSVKNLKKKLVTEEPVGKISITDFYDFSDVL